MSISAELARQLRPHLNAPRWLIAFSGGVDSSVLLHLAVQFSRQYSGPPVAALHVHHGLSDSANNWQAHCRAQCEALAVVFHTENVELLKAGNGIEAAARTARYASFEKHLGKDDILLLGHNQNDQAETLLFRLFRSAGVQGMAGITPSRSLGEASLLRPLLNVDRRAIEAYAKEQAIGYIHDDSNDALNFDRNYIRHKILPVISERWPQSAQTISRSAEYMTEASMLMDDLATLDLALITETGGVLAVAPLMALPEHRQNNVLRYWLAKQDLLPSAAQLAQIKQQFLNDNTATSPEIKLAGWQLNRYQGRLYCEPEYKLSDMVGVLWQQDQPLNLSEHVLLSAEAVSSGGVNITGPVRLNFERASVRFHPVGRGHSNSLKKLMHEHKILPWHRDVIPQLLIDGELAAVPGIGINKRFQAREDQQGYRISLTIGRHRYLCE